MRIPFPERFPLWYVAVFGLTLASLLILTGTNSLFALFTFFFIMITAVAFNVAGGFTRPSGSYIFFFALMGAIIGLGAKVVFNEPAQSRMLAPIPTIETYVGGMIGMLAAAYLSRRFSTREGLLRNIVRDSNMYSACIGCLIFGTFFIFLPFVARGGSQTVFTPLIRASNQLNLFLQLSIVLGVTHQVRSSRGRSSLNIPVLLAWAMIYFRGVVIGYSKESLFSPLVLWLVAAAVQRYNFRPLQILITLVFFFFIYEYMVPYCQYGRAFRDEKLSLSEDVAIATNLLQQLPQIKVNQKIEEDAVNAASDATFFNESHGLVDRLQIISVDDALHVYTDQHGTIGMAIIWRYFFNAVPHVIWKDKPDIPQANVYGHELALLSPQDNDTSISVSPVGEAYRILGWLGILVVAPVIWFLLFVVVDSLCGDLRRSPWGILFFAAFSHAANEGSLASPIYIITIGLGALTFVVLLSGYVLPYLASFVTPPRKQQFLVPPTPRPLPR